AVGLVRLPSNVDRGIIRPGLRYPLDPAFWTARIEIPKGQGKRRLQVREFERFYSDHTVPERNRGEFDARRVIEERLVFVEHVPLP
ncbi:MAG: hypothetical protein V2I57_02260, partial [Xanthomonadales bacterium]|nr:hypothetical protein [Xanthomonadales bacterium]